MTAVLWLILSSLLCSLQLQTGSFPKPLTAEEEREYLARSAQGDLEARNVLIERNLRLVDYAMKEVLMREETFYGGCLGRSYPWIIAVMRKMVF